MLANCASECRAISKCTCGELLCDHMAAFHIRQGHTAAPLTEADQMNGVLGMISCKKEELNKLSTLIVSEVKKVTSEQLILLEELKSALNKSQPDIPSAIDQLSQAQPKSLFEKLINQLGFNNQLQELRTLKNQTAESYKQEKRVLQEKITELTNQLNKTNKSHQDLLNQQLDTPRRIEPVVVSSSDDSTTRIWEDGQARVLQGHTGAVCSVAVSPKKGILVSASDDCTIQVWSLASEQVAQVLKGHTHWVRSLAISSDGKYVVSASYDKTLRVWSLASGLTNLVLNGHGGPIRPLPFLARTNTLSLVVTTAH